MKILNLLSKSFTCPPIILKFFRAEISMVTEISTDFDLLGIVEFQIYRLILPILQANLGTKLEKNNFQNVYIDIILQYLYEKFSNTTHNQTRFPNLCLVHHPFLRTNPRWIV